MNVLLVNIMILFKIQKFEFGFKYFVDDMQAICLNNYMKPVANWLK